VPLTLLVIFAVMLDSLPTSIFNLLQISTSCLDVAARASDGSLPLLLSPAWASSRQSTKLVQLKKRRGTVCFVTQSLLAQPLAIYRTTSLDISLWHQHMACYHQMHIGEFLLRFQVLNTFALAACFLWPRSNPRGGVIIVVVRRTIKFAFTPVYICSDLQPI